MKKIYITLSAGAMLAFTLVLSSCNNAEEAKKQSDAQDAQIQALATTKLNALQDQVNTECTAKVDSIANAQYTSWQEEEKKSHHGTNKPKSKPKQANAKAAPGPAPTNISNRAGSNQSNNNSTISNRQGANSATGNNTNINQRGGAVKKQ